MLIERVFSLLGESRSCVTRQRATESNGCPMEWSEMLRRMKQAKGGKSGAADPALKLVTCKIRSGHSIPHAWLLVLCWILCTGEAPSVTIFLAFLLGGLLVWEPGGEKLTFMSADDPLREVIKPELCNCTQQSKEGTKTVFHQFLDEIRGQRRP